MSEYTYDIINGDFDFHTGEYLGRGGGFPRSYFWKNDSEKWKQVTKFLTNSGIKQHLHSEVLKAYGCKYEGKSPVKMACQEVLQDFEKFKTFALSWKEANTTTNN